MKIYERHSGPEHTGVTTGIHNLAIMNVLLADVREGERLQARALKTWEHVVGPDHPFVARALQEFGLALAQSERHPEAISSFERALAIRKRTLGGSHPATAESLASLATACSESANWRGPGPILRRHFRRWTLPVAVTSRTELLRC